MCASLAVGIVKCRLDDLGSAEAVTDRQTVDCLTSTLTRDEKYRIARLSVEHNNEALRAVYQSIFPRCVVRSDQAERQDNLMRIARKVLNHDPEFQRMLSDPHLVPTQM